MTQSRIPPPHTLELVKIIRRILLFSAKQCELFLERYGVIVHKKTRYEDEIDTDG